MLTFNNHILRPYHVFLIKNVTKKMLRLHSFQGKDTISFEDGIKHVITYLEAFCKSIDTLELEIAEYSARLEQNLKFYVLKQFEKFYNEE